MTLTHSARILLVASTVLGVAGCSRMSPQTRLAPGATHAVIDRLSFGRDIPTGGTVSDSAWQVFLDQVVTPRFPGGFGVMRGEGQWRYADGRIEREDSFHLELYEVPGKPTPDSTFEAIAREYIRRFNQEAVARSRFPVQSWMYWGVKPR
jgi:hypothetical protein